MKEIVMIRQGFPLIMSKFRILRCCARLAYTMPKQKVFLTRSDYPKNGVSLLELSSTVQDELCPPVQFPTEVSPASSFLSPPATPKSQHHVSLVYDLSFWDHEKNGVITKEGMVANVKGVNAIFCSLNDKIDKDVIEAAGDSLKIVSTMSVGVDHVDREILKKKNVKLGYTPDVLTEATAELTVALLLATSRRLLEANKSIREGHWTSPWAPVWMCGPALKGSTVGIVGFGRIGQSTARKLKAFDVGKILYGSEKEKSEGIELGACRTSLDVLLKESDFVIATCALSEKTKGLFSKKNFEKMKPTSIFINTSRGGVVDQEALIDALKNGKIRAAGLDVMTPEPLPADHPLLCLDNCVILPHIGSATYQTRMVMSDLVAKNIIAALEGKEMPAEYK